MPVTPYTWLTDDFFTASRLNGELYRTLGQYYQPNGIGFHSCRPVYKSFYGTNTGFSAGGFRTMGANTVDTWPVVADDGGWFGARGDPQNRGILGFSTLLNGGGGTAGGASNPTAGLGLVTTNLIFGTQANGILAAGLGSFTGASPIVSGSSGVSSSVNNTGQWALDLMDLKLSGGITPWVASTNAVSNVTSNADGSNQACRFQAFWASMYPGNGFTVGSLPAPDASWTGSSPALTAAHLNGTAGIAAVMNLLNMPPALRATGAATGTSVPTSTQTTCVYGTATYDTYSAYNTTTHTYTVPLQGLYLVYNCFPYAGPTGVLQSGVTVNGTAYWGPSISGVSGDLSAATKVQVFSLNAGDTITPITFQSSGSTQTGGSGDFGLMVVLFLGMKGAPASLPSAPDFTYSWAAGTPASQMPTLMNAHFANDLLFLTQRPYLMAYQGTAQTGIAMSTITTITEDTLSGVVHGDAGDNYSGWTTGASNHYTAQQPGWYLAVQETFMATPSLTTAPVNLAGFTVSPSGSYGADFYQACVPGAGPHYGASGLGLYYLRTGDTIKPVVYTVGTSATTTSTYATAPYNSHFELIWLGE